MSLPLPKPVEMFTDIDVKRYAAGSYVSGVWTPGTESTISVKGSIQPAKPDELLNLTEAQRTRAAVKIYTDTLLQTANETTGIQADRAVFAGENWEIQQIWQHTLGIAHYKAIATRLDRS